MLALTVTISAAIILVALIVGVRALRRASRQIDDILYEELDDRDDECCR